MNPLKLLKPIGALLLFFSIVFVPPMIIAWVEADGMFHVFAQSLLVTWLVGGLCFLLPGERQEVNRSDGFLIVTLIWSVSSLCAALPFLLGHQVTGFADAVFETVSGVTTTGATVMHDLTIYPISIQFYHQFLQFFGGLGIIVIASAIMPLMKMGGLHLYYAEMPGPAKDQKIMPRLRQTAVVLCKIYVALNLCCVIGFKLSGLTWFQAMCESFATISTGGFSLHADSFAHYSRAAQCCAMLFMLLGSINFQLHYVFLKFKKFGIYWENFESRYFILTVTILSLGIFVALLNLKVYSSANTPFLNSLFMVLSIISTTGFVNVDFANWPGALPVMMVLIGMIGGCAGSTTGGVKLVRVMVSLKQCTLVLKQVLHPLAIFRMTFSGYEVRDDMIRHSMAFMMLFFYTYIAFFVVLLILGLDIPTAFAALSACISNVGASIGSVSSSYHQLNSPVKLVLSFAMLIGRIEIMSIFVILMPTYWRDI